MAGSELLNKYGSDAQKREEFIRFINDPDHCNALLKRYNRKIRKIDNFAYQTSEGILVNPHELARILNVETIGCHSNDYINLFSGCYGVPVYVTKESSDRFRIVCKTVMDKGRVVFLNNQSTFPHTARSSPKSSPGFEGLLREGEAKYGKVIQYERNPRNRQKAIAIHGTTCKACGFNFSKVYGEHGAGYIEVHHIIPLHQFQESKPIDPSTDLTVLCSNCHRMIHRYKLHYLSIDELKQMIESQQ
ncbi:HNH endonuclease [Paenibacillus sp. GCM10023250]|uniref:HNH endonuclease n=1 Tax=Paenibacillus sp. GCM10023250 TaxID=3252648 RepID=UPI003617DCC6